MGLVERMRSAGGWLAGCLALPFVAILWQSFFWLDRVPVVTRIGYAGLTLLAALRPTAALLATAGLASIGTLIAVLVGAVGDRGAEALVLAFLVGWLSHCIVRRQPVFAPRDTLTAPIALFVIIVAASSAVTAATIQSPSVPLGQHVLQQSLLMCRYYLGGVFPELRHWWIQPVLLIEGVLLLAAGLQLLRQRPGLTSAAAAMLAAGIAAGAVQTCLRLATALMRAPDPVGLLKHVLFSVRLSAYLPELNSAGSHFALALPIVCGLSALGGWRRRTWLLTIGPLAAALWLSGSRAAQLSILITAAVAAAAAVGRRRTIRLALLAILLASAAALILGARTAPESSVVKTLQIRGWFTETSWAMFKTAPVFGIGLGEYFERSPDFMPTKLRELYVHENAHNNFVQVGVELGLTGLAAFLWILWSAWRRVDNRQPDLEARPIDAWNDPVVKGLALGLGAILLTFLTGHPLLVPEVACSFWLTIAALVARADALSGRASPTQAHARSVFSGTRRTRLAAVAAVVVVALVPLRARLAAERVDLSDVRYGFAADVDPATGERFKRVGTGATMFVPAHARTLVLTVSLRDGQGPVEMEIHIDGELANRVTLRERSWTDIRLLLPIKAAPHAFRRVEIGLRRSAGSALTNDDSGPQIRIKAVQIG